MAHTIHGSCLQTLLMRLNEDLQMPFDIGRDATLIVIFSFFREGKGKGVP